MKSSRLLKLPPYLFEELENRFRSAVDQGRDVIDLSIGDPDLPPPDSLISHLETALAEQRHHRYPPQRGAPELKASVRRYLARRAGVEPADDQILILIGSKEGLAHLPWAVCNPGDKVVLPDPGYPVYGSAAAFAGCPVVVMELSESTGYRPDFSVFAGAAKDGVKLCCLNYPNNPTSATATDPMFEQALQVSAESGVIIANDAAYADVYLDQKASPLLCAQPDALEHSVVEFFSFSKMYSITGWRVGFAVGHRDIIEALAHLKANIDSGVFGAIQQAVGNTLDGDGDAYTASIRAEYQARRDLATRLLTKLGFHCFPSCATFYLWTRVPSPWKSMDFAVRLLETADVLVTPGVGFGAGGEGYFRIALTRSVDELETAIHRLARL